jgi:hypothetical protein
VQSAHLHALALYLSHQRQRYHRYLHDGMAPCSDAINPLNVLVVGRLSIV